MAIHGLILTLTLVLVAGLLAELAADLLRLPRMLVLLGVGIVLGPSVAGALAIPLTSHSAQLVFTLGVSLILFHGGLQLSLRVLQGVSLTLALLVVPGVVLSALITGVVAAGAFHLPVAVGLLIGAALAPTDPAILVPLFARMKLRPKVAQTIIAESCFNDPVGAVLALALAGFVLTDTASFTAPAIEFAEELGISTAIGVGFGVLLSLLICTRRVGIWRESAAVAVLAIVAASWFSTYSAGGSGYLGAFLAGLIVGNMHELRLGMHPEHAREMRSLVKTAADIMVIFLFVILGASLPLGSLASHFLPALAVVAALILLARPATVLLSTLLDRRGCWSAPEVAFLAWTRETGVMPVALAGVIAGKDVPGATLLSISVALAVICTLTVQASSKPWLARRLGLSAGTQRLSAT